MVTIVYLGGGGVYEYLVYTHRYTYMYTYIQVRSNYIELTVNDSLV